MIYEDASQLATDSLVEQDCHNRRVYPARQSEYHPVLTYLLAHLAHGTLHESISTPFLTAATYIYHKVFEKQSTLQRVENLRVELCAEDGIAVEIRIFSRIEVVCSISDRLCRCHYPRPLRNSSNTITMAHPHLAVVVKSVEQRTLLVSVLEVLPSIFASASTLYLTTIDMAHILCAIADAKYRQTSTYPAQIYMECVLGIYAQRRAREYHTDDRRVIMWELVVGQYFTKRVQLTYPTAYELGSLRPKVKNNNFLLHVDKNRFTLRSYE